MVSLLGCLKWKSNGSMCIFMCLECWLDNCILGDMYGCMCINFSGMLILVLCINMCVCIVFGGRWCIRILFIYIWIVSLFWLVFIVMSGMLVCV